MPQFKSVNFQFQSMQSVTTTSVRLAAIRLKSAKKNIFRALLSLASAALLSRMMGMVNQVIVTSHFGAGSAMDAYFVATTLPLLLAGLIGSTLEASVIPVYARVRSQQSKEQASLLFSSVLNLLLVSAVLLTAIMFIFRSQLLHLSAPDLNQSGLGLAINLAPFIYPAMLLTVIVGFLECILNAEGQFGWPAYAGLLVPLATATFVLIAGSSMGVVMLCVGMVVGLCLQLVMFIVRAKQAKLVYRPVFNLGHPEIRNILATGWPALLGSLISQISPLIDQIFASFLTAGSISALSYALKLNSVFTGVIFVSVGRAALPYLSRLASENDMKGFKETLRYYLWGVGIGTTLISIFMIIMAHPVVQLLFQRGAFTADDTNRTAITLVGLMFGLTPMALTFITVRAFNALGKNQVLLYLSIFNLVANAIFDYVFAHFWQNEGIALATSAVYFCSMFALFISLNHIIGKLDLLTPPPEFRQLLGKAQVGQYSSKFAQRIEAIASSVAPISYLRQQITRLCIMIVVFAAGVTGIMLNATYTLRVAFGSIIIINFLRYRYALLLTWVLINAFLGSSLPFFSGNNLLSGLTIPTLLLMAYLPTKQAFKRMPALAWFFIYLLWVFVSIGISAIGISSFLTYWLSFLDYVAVGVLTIHLITSRERLTQIIDVILLPATFIALYGIYGYITKQHVLIDSSSSTIRIVSIFGSAPTFALFLSIIIPLALYRVLTSQRFQRILRLIVLLILLVALGLTFTRSALISVPISIVVILFFLPSRKTKYSLLTIFFVLFCLLVLLSSAGNIPIFARFSSQDITSLNGRVYLWQAIISNFDPTQLLGNGLLASNLLLARLQVSASNQGVIATAPHNLFLGILYDHGIIGVTLLIIVFITLARGLIKGILRTTGDRRMIFVIAFAILFNLFFQSLDGSDFWIEGVTIYFWIAMALPFAQCWFVPEHSPEFKGASTDQPTLPLMQALRQMEESQKQPQQQPAPAGYSKINSRSFL